MPPKCPLFAIGAPNNEIMINKKNHKIIRYNNVVPIGKNKKPTLIFGESMAKIVPIANIAPEAPTTFEFWLIPNPGINENGDIENNITKSPPMSPPPRYTAKKFLLPIIGSKTIPKKYKASMFITICEILPCKNILVIMRQISPFKTSDGISPNIASKGSIIPKTNITTLIAISISYTLSILTTFKFLGLMQITL